MKSYLLRGKVEGPLNAKLCRIGRSDKWLWEHRQNCTNVPINNFGNVSPINIYWNDGPINIYENFGGICMLRQTAPDRYLENFPCKEEKVEDFFQIRRSCENKSCLFLHFLPKNSKVSYHDSNPSQNMTLTPCPVGRV